jgi:hypothetical protein
MILLQACEMIKQKWTGYGNLVEFHMMVGVEDLFTV